MDESRYTQRHSHPTGSHYVEIVGYERRDGDWDVFVFAPTGACPELEQARTDESHIFVARVASADDIDRIAQEVDRQLGPSYSLTAYYRETGSRKIIGRIHSHLQRHGAQEMWVRSRGTDDWELLIRQKDFDLAREVIESNVETCAV